MRHAGHRSFLFAADVDIALDGQLEAVSNVTRQRLVAVAAQEAEGMKEPGAVRLVISEESEEVADRRDACSIPLSRVHSAFEGREAVLLDLG
jgi:hypothetical protein